MDKLYIVIPAYNESENIVDVIEQWYPVVEKCGAESRLVIIDDGSRDQTYAIMQEYAKDKPQFLPLTKANSGHGATLLFGYHYALANTPFRLMKANTLQENIDLIPKDFNLSNVIISVIYAKRKLAVKYIPISFRPRQGGVNSINMKKIFRIGVRALKDFTAINRTLKKL